MKNFTPFKLYFFFGFMFSVVFSNAQITIVASDFDRMLDLGEQVTTYLDTTTTILDAGTAGQFSLDYSGLVANSTFVTESKTYADSPYASDFPGAEYASNYEGVFAGVYSNTWVYNSVTDDFLTHGTGTVAQTSAGDVKTVILYSPAWVEYDLPVNLNDENTYSGTQTLKTTTTVPGFGEFTNTIVQNVTISQVVNGYGTVKLPGGKQVNVLRIVEESTFNYNGNISTSTVIKLFSNTGEIISISPSSEASLDGEITVENVSWTSGDGGQVVEEAPTAPDQLSAQTNENSITLSWVDNSNNETGFYIERSGGSSVSSVITSDVKSVVVDSFVLIDSTTADVNTYTDNDVVPGVEYSYRVRAYNESGTSAYSPVMTGMIQIPAVSAPDNLAVSEVGRSAKLSWNDNSDNEIGFSIERSENGGAYMAIDSVSAGVTVYADTSLMIGADYAYRVRAYSEYTVSVYSNVVDFALSLPTVLAPDNLAITASTVALDLMWSDNSDNELGFYLERSEDDGPFNPIDTVAANTTSYLDTGLEVGVVYTYRVQAYGEYSVSEYSGSANGMLMVAAVSAPDNLTVSEVENTAELSWNDNSDNEIGFYIERSEGGAAFMVIDSVSAGVTVFADTSLMIEVDYSYRVQAYNEYTVSDYSNVVDFALPLPVVLAPSDLAITASTVALDLMWSDNSDNELGFYLERSEDGGPFNPIDTVDANTTSYSDTGLEVGVVYTYRVQAYGEYSVSEYSGSANGMLMVAAVSAPDNLAVSEVESTAELSWNDNSDNEIGFYIERSEGGAAFMVIDSVSAGVTVFADTSLMIEVDYSYRVQAYNEYTVSAYSNVVDFALPLPAVLAPSDLAITVSTVALDLMWSDNSDNELGFYLERSEDGGPFNPIDTVDANTTSYSDTGLEVGVVYTYRVQAYGEYSVSEYSGSANGMLMVAAVSAPDNLAVSEVESTAELSWNDNSDNEIGFSIERSADGGAFIVIDSVAAGVIMYTDTTLVADVEYMYRVQAYSEYTTSDYSNSVSVVIELTGIKDEFNTEVLTLKQNYPNPFSSKTTISFIVSRTEEVVLNVFNMKGQLVRSLLNDIVPKGEYNLDFDATGLQNGTYYYQLKTTNDVRSKSMILVK